MNNNKPIANLKKIKFIEELTSRLPAIQLLRNNGRPDHFFSIMNDYRRLKADFKFLKYVPENLSGKRILIVSLNHMLYQIKLEAMLAKGLQLQGCQVSVLTWKHFYWPKKYFELFAIKDYVFFEKYFNQFKNFGCQKQVDQYLSKKLDFQSVKKWTYKGCRIGQQVLSKMARRMYGTPALEDPGIKELLKFYLERQIRAIEASDLFLEKVKPEVLIFNEAKDYIYGAIFDLALGKGLDIIQFIQPIREDSLILKRFNKESNGLHPNSLTSSTFNKIENISWSKDKEDALWQEFSNRYSGKWFLSERNQPGALKKGRKDILKSLNLDQNKKTVVVFSHVLWDANLFYGEDIFQDYEEWFIETVKAACANDKVNWIIKVHPANIWKRNRDKVSGELRETVIIRENIGRIPEHVFILTPDIKIDTFSLFEAADYAVTVRGTTGMEFPCFGKPIFTAGTGRYSGLGFTIDSDTKDQYLDRLSRIQDFPGLGDIETIKAKKHAYAIFNLRPWMMESFKAEFNYQKKGAHPLDHNLHPAISSKEELSRAGDLKRFSDWVLNSKDTDYLNTGF
ncbi:MAG: hypothetical protein JW867_04880 [Candidatus Omnitrophica bacterium]|nr:hypothetical protein [Candidatus Omnitrophota bacterium]